MARVRESLREYEKKVDELTAFTMETTKVLNQLMGKVQANLELAEGRK